MSSQVHPQVHRLPSLSDALCHGSQKNSLQGLGLGLDQCSTERRMKLGL